MKRKLLIFLILLCMNMSACGSTVSSDEETNDIQSSENQDAEVTDNATSSNNDSDGESTKIYNLNKIDMPDPDIDIDDIVPEGYVKENVTWALSYEIVFRIFNIAPISDDAEFLGTCIQTLEAPYTEWEYQIISPDEWVEGEYCIPGMSTLTDYGELYVLLEGTENYYVGKWSRNSGTSADLLDCEYQIINHNIWCKGDSLENFFVLSSFNIENYQTLWLDSDFKEKDGFPQTDGYIWKAVETPISGFPYFLGSDVSSVEITSGSVTIHNKGFTIWAEGKAEPVFTTQYTGMTDNNVVIFYSDTDGFLFNPDGIWNFSIENDSITKINNEYTQWHDACLRIDDSVLILSKKYDTATERFTYTLQELVPETLDHNK